MAKDLGTEVGYCLLALCFSVQIICLVSFIGVYQIVYALNCLFLQLSEVDMHLKKLREMAIQKCRFVKK